MTQLSNIGRSNYAAAITTFILASISVIIRFIVRKNLAQPPAVAEWLCLLSLCLFGVYVGVLIYYIRYSSENGEFYPGKLTTMRDAQSLLKTLFISELLFVAIITTVKISILWFYDSIFFASATFRRVLFATGIGCLMWFIVITFVVIFQCSPVAAFWQVVGRSQHCHNGARTLLAYELTNLFVDIFILCLPIGMLRKTGLPYDRKCAVALIFMLGSFVCITSVVRLRYMWVLPRPETPYDVGNVMLWSTIQLGLAIICACLPTFGPVLKSSGILASRFKSSCHSFISNRFSSDRSKSSFPSRDNWDSFQSYANHTNTCTRGWDHADSRSSASHNTQQQKNIHDFHIGVLPSTRSSGTQ